MSKNHYDPAIANYRKQSLSTHGKSKTGMSDKHSHEENNSISHAHFSNNYSRQSEASRENSHEQIPIPPTERKIQPQQRIRMKHFSSTRSYSDFLSNKNRDRTKITSATKKRGRKTSQFKFMLDKVAEVGIDKEFEHMQSSNNENSFKNLNHVDEQKNESSGGENQVTDVRRINSNLNLLVKTETRKIEELEVDKDPLSGTYELKKFKNMNNSIVDPNKLN